MEGGYAANGRCTTDDGDAIASPRTERMQIRASEMGSALSAAPGLSDNLAMATDLPHHMALGPGDNPSTSSVPARDKVFVEIKSRQEKQEPGSFLFPFSHDRRARRPRDRLGRNWDEMERQAQAAYRPPCNERPPVGLMAP